MYTMMEPNEVEGVARRGRGGAMPSHLTTTLYELLAAIQDVVGPDDDTLVVATVGYLLQSGRLTWLRQASVRLCPSLYEERHTL